MIIAELADGTRLEFPDGTADEVINRTVKNLTTKPAEKPKASFGKPQGLLNAFAQGASFGFSDELYGLVSELTGGDYQSAVDDMRSRQGQFEQDNPFSSFAANLAGGLGTGIGAGGKIAQTGAGAAFQGLSGLGKYGVGIATGAGAGALSGAGTAVEGERLGGAGAGAAIGGALGVLVPPAAYVAGKTANLALKPFQWGVEHLRHSPQQQFIRQLAKNMARDDMTPDMLARNLARLGHQSTVADAGGQSVLGMAEHMAQIPGKARNAAVKVMMERAKQANQRVAGSLLDNIGADDVNIDGAVQALHQNMRNIARDMGYDDILNSGKVQMSDDLQKLMGSSTMKRALGQAYSILDDDIALGRADIKLKEYFMFRDPFTGKLEPVAGMAPGKQPFADGVMRPAGARFDPENLELTQEPTLRVWDYVKRGLDAVINDGTDSLTGKMSSQAERANALKRSLLQKIDDANPEYAAIRAAYADEKAAESAVRLGRSFLREDSEVTARRIKDLSGAEQEFFRMGAARAIWDKVMGAPDTHDTYKRVFGSPAMREKIRAVFPDARSYTKFARQLQREATFSQTKNVVTGNSATFRRQLQQEDAGLDPSVLVDIGTGNFKGAMLNAARGAAKSAVQVPEAVRDEAARLLFSTNPAAKAEVISLLQAQRPFSGTGPLLDVTPYPRRLGGLLGLGNVAAQ